jgi:hypothetical protein
MKRLLAPTSKDSFYISCVLFCNSLPVAGVASPDTMNHPLWIVAGYLFLSLIVRLIQITLFQKQSNPELKMHVAIGPLRILAASFLLGIAIAGFNDFALLSIGIASVFLVLGTMSLIKAGIFLGEKMLERKQVRRVQNMLADESSKRTLAAIDKWMEEQEKVKLDKSLFDDLADFLTDANIK